MRIGRTILTLAVVVVTAAPAEATLLTTIPTPTRDGRARLVIHAAGDVNLDPGFTPTLAAGDYGLPWSGMEGLFLRDDLTIVNLECDPSERGTLLSTKPFSFRCPPAALLPMHLAGIDVVSLGNNHSGDYGTAGLLDGRDNTAAAGLNPVGAGESLAAANQAALLQVEGWTIAVLGFSAASGIAYDWPYTAEDYANLRSRWYATASGPGVAPATVANMTAAVAAVREQADLVVVMLHQGVDNETGLPFPNEVERAHALIDAGADVVFAHHHHRLLPLETYRNRPIFYGLGNFVWPRTEPIRDITAVAEVVVSPDGTLTARLIPAIILTSGRPVLVGIPDYQVRSDRALIR